MKQVHAKYFFDVLSQTSVNYLGHVLSDEGIKPDPKKIRAIEEFARPNCKEGLQRFSVCKNGLGAVLLQEGQTVAYGSVSLTQTQQRYAQIEKELLTVIYGLQHFNYYTYGRIVTVQTDHKPILGLSKKPYDTIYPRLQRMLLRLNKYNIQLEYVPGKNLVIADALSRA
ncbi:retrovirus-related Pol polyprotein from transposon opus [Trichonephila inaurata madagascariensis]|uniref:Retrovirus-related Pol polyprotein from transposon opus n=1 Tax=Trichonephila inaurata madagascariensis TaxID=2747483 RepID=A0A8X7CFN2_9ARAC|nr:retrovirus-related Pol polyprotein from transposon opus [Trichonephila inaurata madagascariensis]